MKHQMSRLEQNTRFACQIWHSSKIKEVDLLQYPVYCIPPHRAGKRTRQPVELCDDGSTCLFPMRRTDLIAKRTFGTKLNVLCFVRFPPLPLIIHHFYTNPADSGHTVVGLGCSMCLTVNEILKTSHNCCGN